MRELTPEEEAKLEELIFESDRAAEIRFDKDDNYQRKLLSGLLQDPCMSEGIALVEPRYWSLEAHVMAYDALKSFWNECGTLPTKFVVTEAVKEKLKDADPAVRLHNLAEVESVYEYYVPGVVESKYLMSELRQWAKQQAFRLCMATLYDKNADGELTIDEAMSKVLTSITDIQNKTATGEVSDCWADIVASQEKEDWLIPNWLEFGSLGMLSGDPFSGKSHILAELFAAIVKHGFFARYKIPSCPVLLFDAENKRRILVKRIRNALGDGGAGDIEALFRRVDTARLALPLPVESGPDTVRQLIQETKKRTGHDRVFVVIDTLRSVFAADEMESGDMKALLYPLQRVAQEENAAILILHHRPKSGATYSGQTSIAGACDYLWLWTSDRDTCLGQLELVGTRGDYEPKLKFVLRDGRNQWIPDGDTTQTVIKNKESALVGMLEHILRDGELKQSEVVKQIQNEWTDGVAPGRDKVRDLLDSLVGTVIMTKKGKDNATFYRLLA